MKAIWTGAIGFGLVNIPIKIYSATQNSALDLDMLDRKDKSNIRFKRINENTGKQVNWENIVKGYLLNDQYIVLEDTDFEGASPEKTKMINLHSFVKIEEVDSIYFDTPYYLEPAKGGEKAYQLLLKALEKSKTAGLGSFVMRSVENLVLVKPHNNLLLLNKIRFEEEIRSSNDLKLPKQMRLKKEEMDMALQLIKQHAQTFDIRQYKNEYTAQLLKIIKKKAKGKHTSIRKIKPRKSNEKADLLSKLKASLSS